jgi:hypothetical protein
LSNLTTPIENPESSIPVESSSSRDFSSLTADTTQHSGEPENETGEVVQQIEALVESFRVGKTKKSDTIFRIGQILADEPTGNEQLKSDSLERFASTLDGIKSIAAKLNRHGMRIAPTILGK